MEEKTNMKALYIIINAGYAEEIMKTARELGIQGATILNARGEYARHESFMGITVDSEKEMILCITDEVTADKIMEAVKEKMGIKTPVHGICFTMPVDKAVGLSAPILHKEA